MPDEAVERRGMTSKGRWVVTITIVFAVATIVVALGLSSGSIRPFQTATQPIDWVALGTRGDFWGGHATLVSALAGVVLFFGALILQAIELAETRNVAVSQAEALEAQQEELVKQVRVTTAQTEAVRHQNQLLAEQNQIALYERIAYLLDESTKQEKSKFFGVCVLLITSTAEKAPDRALELLDYAKRWPGRNPLVWYTALMAHCEHASPDDWFDQPHDSILGWSWLSLMRELQFRDADQMGQPLSQFLRRLSTTNPKHRS